MTGVAPAPGVVTVDGIQPTCGTAGAGYTGVKTSTAVACGTGSTAKVQQQQRQARAVLPFCTFLCCRPAGGFSRPNGAGTD